MNNKKLSTYQYFEILQVEWLVADLRCRIYTNEKDCAYWNKVRDGKRAKIESIADKNQLPTIFTDLEMKRDLERRIYNDYTYPNFHYRDESHKQTQGFWDLTYYYNKDSEVKYEWLGEIRVGKVVDYIPFSQTIRVKCLKTNSIENVSVNKTMRIL